jgi:hypothetical protein
MCIPALIRLLKLYIYQQAFQAEIKIYKRSNGLFPILKKN